MKAHSYCTIGVGRPIDINIIVAYDVLKQAVRLRHYLSS